MLDFNEKLSVAKSAKQYRLVADHLIVFYSTFMLMPSSAPRKSRVLILMVLMAALFAQLLLYEQFPEFEDWTMTLKLLVFSAKAFKDYAVYNMACLIQFFNVAVFLSTLLAWRLAAVNEEGFVDRVNKLVKSPHNVDWRKETQSLTDEYKSFGEGIAQNKKYSKLIDFALVGGVLMTLGIFVLDYLETVHTPPTE